MSHRVGDVDSPGAGYQWRKITPAQAAAIAVDRASGVPASVIAEAYGVSVRTIYRAVACAQLPMVRVAVGSWHAEFMLTDDGPVRATAWHATSGPA